ncbi:MAG: thermonuclease family protein [Chloroflexi bacterium]|nr:thermonuclease family protein [Chloroflexota bacterium]
MAVVTHIVDGDTIDVEINGEVYRVRYIGMDTPERGDSFFQEATDANAQLVAGQKVILVKDVSETDRYDRLLRYVYLEDGTFVNGELVRLGFAQSSSYPPDVALQEIITSLQRAAVNSGVGLWASPAVVVVTTNTTVPRPTNPPAPPTEAPQPTNPPAPPTEAPQPTQAPPVAAGLVVIVGVNKQAEYVDIQNQGGTDVDLSGWVLLSEKGVKPVI